MTPDEEIEDAPGDYAAGRDAQLERSTQRMLQLLEEQPIEPVRFTARPTGLIGLLYWIGSIK